MINKSNLWFLTLSSIILVLAIYYVAIPVEESNMVFSHKQDNSNIETTIQESEILTAMRVTKEEEHLNDIQNLQNILLDSTKTINEKNEAYEKLQFLNSNKSLEEKLESTINKTFKVSSFVEIKDNSAKITIINKEHSYTLANDIILAANKEIGNEYYVTVKFN